MTYADLNRESYNAIASSWDAARSSPCSKEREYIQAFLATLGTRAHVLDLGCGTGRPIAETILNSGHRVTGVDQAAALLDLARARYPHATWIESRIENFVAAKAFDAIVCWDALFHIERSRHEALLAHFADMLRAEGRLMMTCGGSASSVPAFTDTMYGQEFFYDSHSPDQVLRMLATLGFKSVLSGFTNLPTGGRDKGRYALVAERS